MKRFLLIFFLLCFYLFSQDQNLKPAKYLFKIATEVPAGSLWHKALMDINKELMKETNGELRLQIFPGGVMGDQASVINKVTLGQLNGATFSNTGMQVIYQDFGVVGFPLIMRNEKEFDYFVANMGSFFEQKFKERGYTLLAWTETGPIYIYSKKPIDSEETIRTAKTFVLNGDKTTEMLFREIKASPIPLNASDILTSLKTGQIDTVFSPPYGLIAMQWHTNVNYVTDFTMTFMLGSVMVDNKLFDSMPKDYQRIMFKYFREYFEAMKQKIRKDNLAAQEILKQNGIISVPVSEANKKRFFDVCLRVNEKLIQQYGYSRELYNKVYNLMTEFRKNNKE